MSGDNERFPYLYERGEHRHKHCWNEPFAGFRPGRRGAVGKCPNTLDDSKALEILAGAVPFFEDDADEHPARFYAVHAGVVYEAAPTRPGLSYHGYPWRGRMPRAISRKLETLAEESGCQREFKKWLKEYAE